MYYSELVDGLRDMTTFDDFKDINIRPSVVEQIKKLYNVDEGSAFYTLLGMLFVHTTDDFGDCSVMEGLAKLHHLGRRKLEEIEIWAMGTDPLTRDTRLSLAMSLAWQSDSVYVSIDGHRLFSTVNGSYASNGIQTWSNYLIPGAMWTKQREEVLSYVRTDHWVIANRQYRYAIADMVRQIRRLYREKSYLEFITVLGRCQELIKRG